MACFTVTTTSTGSSTTTINASLPTGAAIGDPAYMLVFCTQGTDIPSTTDTAWSLLDSGLLNNKGYGFFVNPSLTSLGTVPFAYVPPNRSIFVYAMVPKSSSGASVSVYDYSGGVNAASTAVVVPVITAEPGMMSVCVWAGDPGVSNTYTSYPFTRFFSSATKASAVQGIADDGNTSYPDFTFSVAAAYLMYHFTFTDGDALNPYPISPLSFPVNPVAQYGGGISLI